MQYQTHLSIQWRRVSVGIAVLLGAMALTSDCQAQKDTVFLKSGSPVRGTLQLVSPDEVRVGDKTVAVRDVKKFNLNTAPRELKRAKENMTTGQYAAAWTELQKIGEPPRNPIVRQEFEYAKAYTMGKLALSSGQISTRDAGSAILDFISSHPNSYRLYPTLDLYGQLLVNINRLDLAEIEFAKLAASNWPEYQLKGLFDLAEAQMMMEKFSDASQNYAKLKNHELSTSLAQHYKLLATCQAAKANALQGNVDEAIATVENIIKNQNADNSELFALCYNTLGVCNLKKNELRGAAIAFLHTDLLFSTEAAAHSEALYHLAKIWPQLNETDRANSARQTLSGTYANSIWKLKMDQGN